MTPGAVTNLYALRHTTCGHVVGVGNSPEILERVRSNIGGGWSCDWRITPNPTDADLTQLVRGEHCSYCASALHNR